MSELLNNKQDPNSEYEKWRVLEDNANNSGTEWDSLAEYEAEGKENLPSPGEKMSQLKFDSLSNLSTDEYLELWCTLNPFYVTHVTRQGIRDHNAMMEHSGGLGSYHDSFRAILQDGKELCSPAEARFSLPADFTEDDVAGMLEEYVFSTDRYDDWAPERILDSLPMNWSIGAGDPWGNVNAIHMAQHTVLNEIYGGENKNEIFFVFPTDVVASQCRFGGSMHQGLDTAQVNRERKWNDMYVWPENGRIPIDAGLVFLPKSQMVDKKTGSRYATEEVSDEFGNISLMPQKDEERITRFIEWVDGLTEDSPEFVAKRQDRDNSLLEAKLKEIGIPRNCWDNMIYFGHEYELMNFAKNKGRDSFTLTKEEQELPDKECLELAIRRYLSSLNADLKEAEDVIPSEEYWENHFAEHPDQKPAHIVYYDGDPSTAVRDFLKSHGILEEASDDDYDYNYITGGDNKKKDDDYAQQITGPGDTVERDGKMLGFEANHVADAKNDPKMSSEHQRFNEIALAILQQVK